MCGEDRAKKEPLPVIRWRADKKMLAAIGHEATGMSPARRKPAAMSGTKDGRPFSTRVHHGQRRPPHATDSITHIHSAFRLNVSPPVNMHDRHVAGPCR